MYSLKLIVISLISLIGFQAEGQSNFNITVTVEEADSNDGKMFIALYNSEADFLNTAHIKAQKVL